MVEREHGHGLNWPDTSREKAAFDLYLLAEQCQLLKVGLALAGL